MSVLSSQIVHPPICIEMPLLLPYFSNFPAIILRKLGPSWEKIILLKSSLERLSTLLISFSFEELEFSTIFTHLSDQAYNRIMATNNKTLKNFNCCFTMTL